MFHRLHQVAELHFQQAKDLHNQIFFPAGGLLHQDELVAAHDGQQVQVERSWHHP